MTSKIAEDNLGQKMFDLVAELFPICRSITGNGVRESLQIIQKVVPLSIHEVPTGTQVFDWTIPKEWNIRDAYIQDEDGNKIVDFKKNNLHIVGYSTPIDAWVDFDELDMHLYSLENQPDAIPYITSYYSERWGFCISHQQRMKLDRNRKYRVYIDSDLTHGSLTYGELILPGKTEQEVFLSAYICHPSMANNELSGPVVTAFLAEWLMSIERKYTYRIVFIPETIGSITYLSRNLEQMKKNIIAGFNITCVGDSRSYSFLPTRYGTTLSDKVALYILENKHPDFVKYSFLERGSDERQYCSPGVDLPVASIMRTKYGEYPEYHTSLDNLDLVSAEGLYGAFDVLQDCIKLIEKNEKYQINCLCEPQLGKRGLYSTLSAKGSADSVRSMMNFIAYADGTNDLIDISRIINMPVSELDQIIAKLIDADLLRTT
ncbi:DUF4910 domain-containing protein [Brevibacillus borstelensis]|uniref:DUF4910 domain-containing protein n=1 Tax=Brevibacillus borstelensis TaxID=45462 RepID=UPI002E217AE5|nr:DUF4910 domain-containing protein [Brevibacillus borstelensis]